MRVGVARETTPGERRVALVPETAGRLVAAGFDVIVEAGAGDAASFPDELYAAAGASLGSPWEAEAVVKVRKPDDAEVARLHDGQVLIGFLDPLADPDGGSARLAWRARVCDGVDPADDACPVDGRASSQGDRRRLQRSGAACGGAPAAFLPMLMTAAGTVPPAKVLSW
jgi:NAD(P) transhydrogenase subunit alpha